MENNIPGIPEPCQQAGQEMMTELANLGTANTIGKFQDFTVKPKARPHNHKKITALEKELADIRGNRIYRILAWLRILPRERK